MKAEPYGTGDSEPETRKEFLQTLAKILQINSFLGDEMDGRSAADIHITLSMESLRIVPWEDRKLFYLVHRIRDQREWYRRKSIAFRSAARVWTAIGITVYFLGFVTCLLKISYPDFKYWPQEPLILIASAIVGWVQIKKFRELASSYSLTALEIGLIEDGLANVESEEEFVEFVNDAEQGFSREHIQWVARQRHAA